jgi:exopolyphosphatase/guanosine-5'-triphosphate,3'-diphosphate pyrophosphatase
MIVASIDIGTNTVLLLIAEVDRKIRQIHTLHEEQRIPRLGEGLHPGGEIKKDKIEELLKVLSDYIKKINSFDCDRTILTGTNALRIAKNSQEILTSIEKKFGLKVQIISGEKEAQLAYLGSISGVKNSGTSLVIDIGGGSTEIIFGERDKILFNKSFSIGSVSASEKYFLHYFPSQNELNNLQKEIRNVFRELNNFFTPTVSIGVAGTITTLACMIKGIKNFDGSIIDNSVISLAEVASVNGKIVKMNPAALLSDFGEVLKGREDIIAAGSMILYELMLILKINKLTVSSRGLRYGAILEDLFSNN